MIHVIFVKFHDIADPVWTLNDAFTYITCNMAKQERATVCNIGLQQKDRLEDLIIYHRRKKI